VAGLFPAYMKMQLFKAGAILFYSSFFPLKLHQSRKKIYFVLTSHFLCVIYIAGVTAMLSMAQGVKINVLFYSFFL
jgi:precorrin-2 methylase